MQKREFDETNAVHTWRRGAGGRRGIRLPRGKGPLLKVDDAAAQGVGVRFHLRKLIDSSSISMSVSTSHHAHRCRLQPLGTAQDNIGSLTIALTRDSLFARR